MEHVPDYSNLKSFTNLPVIFKHWRARRTEREGKSIIPQLKFEETLKNEADPYVCFRRRETKPIRKTRRTDQQSLERLRKLRTEMEMARNLLEMVLRREKIRKEGLVLEHTVFEKKRILHEYQRTLGIKEDEDLMPKKKRKAESSGATIKIPLHRLNRIHKTPAQLAMEAELARKKEVDAPYEDVTSNPYQPFPLSTPQQFFRSLEEGGPKFRKRMGRNGRVFMDRMGYKPNGGKTLPGSSPTNRYRFDSDMSEDEVEIDEMESLYLNHRVGLLAETELRSLVTVPFSTPLNMMRQATVPPPPVPTPSTSTPPSSPVAATTTSAIKRQNSSRTKMTPQQAAVAMANGMIAANISAVVNGNTTNKAAMQMAMAAAQQQQANKQQKPPLSLHF